MSHYSGTFIDQVRHTSISSGSPVAVVVHLRTQLTRWVCCTSWRTHLFASPPVCVAVGQLKVNFLALKGGVGVGVGEIDSRQDWTLAHLSANKKMCRDSRYFEKRWRKHYLTLTLASETLYEIAYHIWAGRSMIFDNNNNVNELAPVTRPSCQIYLVFLFRSGRDSCKLTVVLQTHAQHRLQHPCGSTLPVARSTGRRTLVAHQRAWVSLASNEILKFFSSIRDTYASANGMLL